MVQIPGSRDVGRVSARSGRITPSGPTVSVGEGIAQFGNAMQQVAYDLNDLRTQEAADNQNKAGFDLETNIARFRDEEEQRFLKAREEASESGIGFTRQFIEGYQKRANDFGEAHFNGLNDAQKERAKQSILGLGNSLYGKAYGYEQQSKTNFYDRTTNQGLDGVRTQIKNNSAPYEELKRQGLAAIDAADMPEAWKAERRALWDADAAESKWQWKFGNDPQTAIREIRGQPTGNVVDKIIGVESGGNATAKNPNSSATGAGQFIASTWMNMIKKHRPDIAQGKSASEILALRNDPALSREMTAAYTAENGDYLKNQGIETTDGNLYLAHFLGPGGASRVIKADPSAPVASIIGQDAVNANPFLKGKTIADLRAWSDKKMGGAGISTDYDAIPYDRREQLANWGENQYNQQVVQQRTATKDGYNLLIATSPDQVSESVILQDPMLDNGDKATLINALNKAREEGASVNAALPAFAAGNLGSMVDPYATDGRKLVDKLYEKVNGGIQDEDARRSVAEEIVRQSGVVPQKLFNGIRGGLESTDVSQVEAAAQMASRLSQINPAALSRRDGGAQVQGIADDFSHYVNNLNMTPGEAAKRIAERNNPDKQRERKALEPAAKEFAKQIEGNDLAEVFDESWLPFTTPDVGFTESQRLGIQAEYQQIAQEQFYRANGDAELAQNRAKEEMKRLYGVTNLTGRSVVMKYPPERFWPKNTSNRGGPLGVGADPFGYVKTQLYGEIYAADPEFNPNSIQYVATPATAAMIKRGEMPAYAIMFQDKNGNWQTFPGKLWRPDVAPAKRAMKNEQDKVTEQAREADDYMRAAAGRERSLDNYLDGDPLTGLPRQPSTAPQSKTFNPGPIGGGGTP